MPSRSGIQEGETITVKENENIYAIAREHNVSMRDLIVLNNLKPPFEIHPGQSLVLPAGATSFAGDMPVPQAAPLAAVEKNQLAPIEPAGVSQQALEPITLAPTQATPTPRAATIPIAPSSMAQPAPEAVKPAATAPTSQAEPVQLLNRPTPTQKPVATTMSEPGAAAASSSIDMVWPVQGPILSPFGPKGAGLNNDGVNIAAPRGAPVVAAASGAVVYAGDEMKGFGNLVLIRHEGDWVTAYSHLDRVMVKKDSIVAQGDTIGTVGKTGNVSTPQLHFETRHNGKPVDPASVVKGSQ